MCDTFELKTALTIKQLRPRPPQIRSELCEAFRTTPPKMRADPNHVTEDTDAARQGCNMCEQSCCPICFGRSPSSCLCARQVNDALGHASSLFTLSPPLPQFSQAWKLDCVGQEDETRAVKIRERRRNSAGGTAVSGLQEVRPGRC